MGQIANSVRAAIEEKLEQRKAQINAAVLEKKLIEEAGRLNVPGRPIQYKTTPDFLRTFGISSLEELPPIDKVSFGEPIPEIPEQISMGEGQEWGGSLRWASWFCWRFTRWALRCDTILRVFP